MHDILLTGDDLPLEALLWVAQREARVALGPTTLARLLAARALVDKLAEADAPTYGINTGFGDLAETRIDRADLQKLQRNLILSHSAGVGTPLPPEETRCLMLLRANVLAKGYSGVRLETLETLLAALARDLLPMVPERGSVGASGDLAPLAHLAAMLIGEGDCFFEGRRLSAPEGLRLAGLQPIVLEAKEGLALINGTQAICAVGGLALLRAEHLTVVADITGAATLEGLKGSHRPFGEALHRLRPHRGQLEVAKHLRDLLAGSAINASHQADCDKVQDPYSLRCMPQVHGAVRDGLQFCRAALAIEINSATDNPLVFTTHDGASDAVVGDAIVSGGNFHGQPVAQAMDFATIAMAQLAGISERRIEQLVNPQLSGLPPFLAPKSGLHSGFMMAQVTAAALVAELRLLAHPACVESIPTSANKEDFVSMGMLAALKARQAAELLRTVLAIELLCACQALDLRTPLESSRPLTRVLARVRSEIPPMWEDRLIHDDILKAGALIDSGEIEGAASG
jgi:histidine ammonia-lyase